MSATRWYATWPNPRSRSWRSESCENGQFQSVSPLPICMQSNKLIVNCDTPRQYLIFFPDRCLLFIFVRRHVTFILPSSWIFKWWYLWNGWLIDFVFDSRVRFSGMEDRLDLFLVAPNRMMLFPIRSTPRWRPWWHDSDRRYWQEPRDVTFCQIT